MLEPPLRPGERLRSLRRSHPAWPGYPGRLEAERRGEIVVSSAVQWLRDSDKARPFFIWVHLYDPHAPYTPPAAFLARANGHTYDAEVAYADAQVARVHEAARATARGHLLVAVAGDHGEGLGEHGEATHGMLAYDATLRVPLLLAGPGLSTGQRVAAAVSLRDARPAGARFACSSTGTGS